MLGSPQNCLFTFCDQLPVLKRPLAALLNRSTFVLNKRIWGKTSSTTKNVAYFQHLSIVLKNDWGKYLLLVNIGNILLVKKNLSEDKLPVYMRSACPLRRTLRVRPSGAGQWGARGGGARKNKYLVKAKNRLAMSVMSSERLMSCHHYHL